jgi:HEAT repeat protein
MAQRLLQHAGLAVDAFYRQLIEVTPTAILGLGEVGERADSALVAPFARSERPAVREAAINALRLNPDEHLELLVAALEDPDSRVACAAARRLRRRVEVVGIERLLEIGGRALTPDARARAIHLLLMLPGDRFLTEVLADRHRVEGHRDFVLEALRTWRARRQRWSPSTGDPGDSEVLARLLRQNAEDRPVAELLDLSSRTGSEAPLLGLAALGATIQDGAGDDPP